MKAEILHISGFDTYNTHDSGNYIIFDYLRELKYDSKMILAISKTKSDNDTFFIPKNEIVNSIEECKVLILHDEILNMDEVEQIYKKTNCKILVLTQTHCHLCDEKTIGDRAYPELDSDEQNNLNKNILFGKKEIIKRLPIDLVVFSSHSKDITENYHVNLYENKKIHLIPFPSKVPYCEIPKQDLRNRYNLSNENKYILWGTTQPESFRKGKVYFDECLKILYEMLSNEQKKIIKILSVGPKPKTKFAENKFEVKYFGYLKTRQHMSVAYKISDISVCTTLSDAGPMMISESLCNNTPVIAFNKSIANDLIIDEYSGYLIKNLSTKDMAEKIYKILFLDNLEYMSDNARKSYLKFHDKSVNLKKWQDLFTNLLEE
jgi:glycosyltransferase involved in cell wall biosynthesis